MAWLAWNIVEKDPTAGPWLTNAMLNASDVAAYGEFHNWGFNAIPGAGPKQGRGDDSYWVGPMAVHTVGFTDNIVAAVLQSGPNYGVYNQMFETSTYTTRKIVEASMYTPGSPVDAKWSQVGGLAGPGRATSGYICGLKDGWCYQDFEVGFIHRSPSGSMTYVRPPIQAKYKALDYERSWAGFPGGDFVDQGNGWGYQLFQGGALIAAPNGAVYESRGPIRVAWGLSGYEHGPLGYPVSDMVNQGNGWSYQLFQHGALLLNPQGEVITSKGAIRAAWQSTGFERGPLGCPTANEKQLADGSYQQVFQKGTITWKAGVGATIEVL